jgi:hypothetical protein
MCGFSGRIYPSQYPAVKNETYAASTTYRVRSGRFIPRVRDKGSQGAVYITTRASLLFKQIALLTSMASDEQSRAFSAAAKRRMRTAKLQTVIDAASVLRTLMKHAREDLFR